MNEIEITESEIKSLNRVVRHYIADEKLDCLDNCDSFEIDDNHIYYDLLVVEKLLVYVNQIKKCPSCGESEFEIIKTDEGFKAECYICEIYGSVRLTEEEAIISFKEGMRNTKEKLREKYKMKGENKNEF